MGAGHPSRLDPRQDPGVVGLQRAGQLCGWMCLGGRARLSQCPTLLAWAEDGAASSCVSTRQELPARDEAPLGCVHGAVQGGFWPGLTGAPALSQAWAQPPGQHCHPGSSACWMSTAKGMWDGHRDREKEPVPKSPCGMVPCKQGSNQHSTVPPSVPGQPSPWGTRCCPTPQHPPEPPLPSTGALQELGAILNAVLARCLQPSACLQLGMEHKAGVEEAGVEGSVAPSPSPRAGGSDRAGCLSACEKRRQTSRTGSLLGHFPLTLSTLAGSTRPK